MPSHAIDKAIASVFAISVFALAAWFFIGSGR